MKGRLKESQQVWLPFRRPFHHQSPPLTEHRYDVLGNRIQTILPTGEVLNRLYYGSGHLHHINLDGTTLADIERVEYPIST